MWGYRDKCVLTYFQLCDKTFPVSNHGKATEGIDKKQENIYHSTPDITDLTVPHNDAFNLLDNL